jgi:hypothetical protein
MSTLKHKAGWKLLTEEEQLVLQLNLGMDKSTWKAGEIMKKSHYKLIEIMDRAKTFLKIFSNHYDEYGQLIPRAVRIDPDFKVYLEMTMLKRFNVHASTREIDNPLFHRMATRDELIAEQMLKWRKSVIIEERDLYNLVMDFDRWNNFRIMPKSIQEPSAFKRRNKNKLKKHLYIGTNVPQISYKVIKDEYEYKQRHHIKEGYVCIITVPPRRAEIIRIHLKEENLAIFSRVSLYIFDKEEVATDYMAITLDYINKSDKHCVEGLRFWPQYRILIKQAVNYDKIQNIIPSRRNLEFISPNN